MEGGEGKGDEGGRREGGKFYFDLGTLFFHTGFVVKMLAVSRGKEKTDEGGNGRREEGTMVLRLS